MSFRDSLKIFKDKMSYSDYEKLLEYVESCYIDKINSNSYFISIYGKENYKLTNMIHLYLNDLVEEENDGFTEVRKKKKNQKTKVKAVIFKERHVIEDYDFTNLISDKKYFNGKKQTFFGIYSFSRYAFVEIPYINSLDYLDEETKSREIRIRLL